MGINDYKKEGKLISHAFPGGYPVYYLDGEGSALCPDCANRLLDDNFAPHRPVTGDVNWEDKDLHCDACCQRIEPAY